MTDIQLLAEKIKDIKFTMMTTVDNDGSMHSRPMATQDFSKTEFDGTLYFFTKLHSPKVYSIENDQHITLAYANPDKQLYVSVVGRGSITQDKELMERLWNPALKAWFPEGLEDPEIAVIVVKVDSADLWDSPPSKVVQLAGFVKATVTGKPYDHKAHTQHIQIDKSDRSLH
jgi:general stress protein 26